MKKTIIVFLLVTLTLCGCQRNSSSSLKDNDGQSAPSPESVPAEYEDTIADYQKIVEFRCSDSFDADYDSGKNVTLNETLQADLSDETDTPEASLRYKWNCMVVDMLDFVEEPSLESFGYILKDLNQDDSPELLWVNSDRNMIFAVFTISNGSAKLLDAYWPRYKAVLSDAGELHTLGSGGADVFCHDIMIIDSKGDLKAVASFGRDRDKYYVSTDNGTVETNESTFNQMLSDYPYKFGNSWGNSQLNLLSSY